MIYEINQDIEILLEKYYNCFDSETGEQIVEDNIVEAIQKELQENQNKLEEFKEWILKKRANDLADINWIDSEIKRLSEMKAKRQNKVKQWENFIKYIFWELEKPIYFANFQLGYRKSKSVELSEDFNEKEYIKEKISYAPDKTLIKKDLESWKKIKGASIKENKNFYIK